MSQHPLWAPVQHPTRKDINDNKKINEKANLMTQCPLQFLEFQNNDQSFIGMLDSGAQLNIMSANLTDKLEGQFEDSIITVVQGFNGVKASVLGAFKCVIRLENSHQVEVEFTVVSNLATTIILGLPFLCSIGGILDHRNLTLTTDKGIVSILTGRKAGQYNVNMVKDVLSVADNETLSELEMPHLTIQEKQQVLDLLGEFREIWEGKKKGTVKGIEHCISLDSKRPIHCKPRKFCPEHHEVITKEVGRMLADNIIRHSNSPYASEIVMVKKKTGEWRFCIDYRLINRHTIPDTYPFPRINELIMSAKGASYFVALDLRSGYWQIPMEEQSKSATAFRCPMGLFEFEVMPFGLSNAPATFQRTMDFLFNDLYHKGVSIYLDDILVYANSFDDSLTLLTTVFSRLRASGLTINMKKSTFFQSELEYLGHIIGKGIIKPNPKRVELLQAIAPAKTVREIRRILGLFGFYQFYIPGFSAIAAPLTSALRGRAESTAKITWTNEMQEAVSLLGKLLGKAVLTVPLDSDTFLLETDASDLAVAGILSVNRNGKWEPVEFVSKKLGGPQLRWPIREKEAYAIIYCLQKFDSFLRGKQFTVHTDHQSLRWLEEATMGKLARWASRLGEYQMTILWKKGTEMVHVDCLSRQVEYPDDIQPRMIYHVAIDPNPLPKLTDILAAQPTLPPIDRGFVQKNNIIYYRNGVWVPEEFRLPVIAACHSLAPYCHPGVKRTKSNILKVFNWSGLHDDVTHYVRSCIICQRMRPGLERVQGLLQTHPIPCAFETIYMDFWHCMYAGKKQVVLTIVDQATKWAEAVPIPNQKAETVAAALLTNWITRFGVPRMMVTDNDPPLVSEVMNELANQLGIRKLRTSPYHPQGNAPIEAFHKTINQRLYSLEKGASGPMPFPIALQLVLWSYRAVIHSTMGESPAFLVYGMDPRPPIENDWRAIQRVPEQQRVRFLNNLRNDIYTRALQRLTYRNMEVNRRDVLVEEGTLVLVRRQPTEIRAQSIAEQVAPKLSERWGLPGRVMKRYGQSNRYLVRDLLSAKEREVHITDLRCIEEPKDEVQRRQWDVEIMAEAKRRAANREDQDVMCQQFWVELEEPRRKRACIQDFEGDDEKPSDRTSENPGNKLDSLN
jgi:Reverse transcriptase (RNA-dependent DNA polymerase)/RNase H-like domain found in reverse transcriptase/Integrase zinc binding domain/Integrase core domain/Aspartyl protease